MSTTTTDTSTIAGTALAFFDACDTGKGWEGCSAYCQPNATFASQAEPLADLRTLEEYTDWMKALMGFIPDGRYDSSPSQSTTSETTSARTASSMARTAARAARSNRRASARARTMSTSWTSA